MVDAVVVESEERRWQRALARAIRDPRQLLTRLGLPTDLLSDSATADFPVLVPESYVERMAYGDPECPLLRQVLPIDAENSLAFGFGTDPVGDLAARDQPGLLRKYHGRALLIAHGSCAIHCRYCFRRHYPYGDDPRTLADWHPALDTIADDPSLTEVILSRGDPPILSDRRLAELVGRLAEMEHVKRLRIHSRLPVVLPERVTEDLCGLLRTTRLRTIIVVHANHANELTGACATALEKLIAWGLPVLNQAVLLAGVNDSTAALADLCERCIDLGVMPYYLHQLDRVRGAAHFEVPVKTGRQLVESLRERLPGYAIPKYVQEIPGAQSKTPLL